MDILRCLLEMGLKMNHDKITHTSFFGEN